MTVTPLSTYVFNYEADTGFRSIHIDVECELNNIVLKK